MSEERVSTVTRRGALTNTIGFIAACATTRAALADSASKVPQTAVQYQTAPKSGRRCVDCSQFRTPDGCQLVQGPISPAGWCRLFSPKSA
jgi:hypothetical protein